MEQLDLTFVDQVVEKAGTGKEKVLEILQAIQGHYGYLPDEALQRVCALTEITPASIAGVYTFYDQFRHRPAGRHIIHVCVPPATSKDPTSLEEFRRHLEIPVGETRMPRNCSPWRRSPAWAAARWPRRCRSTRSPMAI
jgi:NADH-quinone oxidoreductase subunit F